MKENITILSRMQFICILLFLFIHSGMNAMTHSIKVVIHIRGVIETNVSLLGRIDSERYKTIEENKNIRSNEISIFSIPVHILPGEFVIRFDYKEKETSTPYPCEKFIFINDQDLELWVNPMYCNNPDSSWFQKDERENAMFRKFTEKNSGKKEKLGLLQNFLLNYDDPESEFYQQGIIEYEKRRQSYNQWLQNMIQKDSALFVSNLYRFEYVPEIRWNGTENDRIKSLIDHYFDGMDFSSPLIIRTPDMKKWMDAYVNLYGQLSVTVALRDSLFPLAGTTAIEKAKKGHPLVYGWMVDYFYRGYEANGINAGMKILEPYLNDPNCLTTKRIEINKRLEGIKSLVPGTRAPDISGINSEGRVFTLYSYSTQSHYLLILFWSAGCSHCMETVDALYQWQQKDEINRKVDVIAIGLDETKEDILKWKQLISGLETWQHIGEPQGVNGKVANDYFILSTPVMILVESETKNIVALPVSLKELMHAVR